MGRIAPRRRPTRHRPRAAGPTPVAMLVLSLLAFAPAGCEDSPTEPGGSIPFDTIVQDSVSARQVTARREVVRDELTWRSVWQEIFPGAPPAAVDFDREMTVVAVMAPQPCTARVTIEALRRESDRLTVSLVENPTPEGCACVASVQPFHLVRTARLDLPAEFVARTGPPAICGS